MNRQSNISGEMRLIPAWSIVLAVAGFVAVQILFPLLIERDPQGPPVPVRYLIAFLVGTVLSFLLLLAGYVSRDARRRGMNPVLWPLVGIFVSNGIGFIIYFLLRKPLLSNCARCAAELPAGFNFCPRCGAAASPSCRRCQRTLQADYSHCPYCGAPVNHSEQVARTEPVHR